jgi:hypothetical protein
MTIPTSDYTTYDATGNREDLIDVITNISPTDAWFTSNSGSTRAKARYHEWQIDVLAAPAANAQIEGNTKTATAVVPTTRTGNYTQILSKEFMVTETQETVDKAGRASEVAYQTTKNMKELAMDIEYALLINASAVSGDTATARQLKGVLGWITGNTYTGTATGNATPLLAASITTVLALIWADGGKPQHILCGAWQKKMISAMTTSATKYVDAPTKTVVDSVNVYDTDFGRIAIHLSTVLNGASNASNGTVVILGDMGLWSKAWLRPVKKKELPIASFSSFFSIEAELTLESRNQNGSGRMYNLTIA